MDDNIIAPSERVVNIKLRSTGSMVMRVDPRTRKVTDQPMCFIVGVNGKLIPTNQPASEVITVDSWRT